MKKIVFYTILFCCVGCRNASKEKERIRLDIDSINNSLNNIDTLLYPSRQEYAALLAKAAYNNETRQGYYTITDFQGYISNLRMLFTRFAGDSTGMDLPATKERDISVTNAFFRKGENTSDILYSQLSDMINVLLSAKDTTILKKARHFGFQTVGRFPSSEKLLYAYFHDTPPVAVLTILNSFEQTVNDLYFAVLNDHFQK